MRKLLFIIPITLFLAACGGDASSDESNMDNAEPTSMKSADEEPELEELGPSADEVLIHSIIGEWTCGAATAGIQVDMNIKDDGTISQKLGPNSMEGRYRASSKGNVMQIINDKGEIYQTWEIKNITENSMDVCWNPESAKPKTIPMTRK